MLTVLASYRRVLGDDAGARSAAREAVEDYVTRKNESIFVVASIEELALSCALDGDPSVAAILSGYVAVGLPERGNPEFDFHAATQRRLREELEKRLGPSEVTRLRADGERLSMLEVSVLALDASA
jgi:hypothetical protein